MAKLPPSTGFYISSNLSCSGILSASFSTERACMDRNHLGYITRVTMKSYIVF